MIRAFQPTDLSGLVMLTARSLANRACPRERLGERTKRIRAGPDLMAAWMVPSREREHTFLWTAGRKGGGLLSCRSLPGFTTWEVDRLLLSSDDSAAFCQELLGRLASQAADTGIHRLFLRLAADSALLDSVGQAGFTPYVTESLYVRDNQTADETLQQGLLPGVRRRQSSDDLLLLQLYNAAAPLKVRVAEGLTLRQWQEAMTVRWRSGRWVSDLLLERDAQPTAWLRIAAAGRSGYLALTVHPDSSAIFPHMVRQGLQRLASQRWTFFILPDYQDRHAPILADLGFEKAGEFISLVWKATERVKSPRLVPAQVT